MRSDDLNAMLAESGVASSWQAALVRLGLAVAHVAAPRAFALLERLVTTGATALLQRLEEALLPDETVDIAYDIVRGLERDCGDTAPPERRMTGPERGERAREAIRLWMIAQGGRPDAALVNEVMERAVGQLRAAQAAANQRLSGGG